tara:strand:- start:427 stop:933 length:507 start_codon:yes stop_codon:yes gene_type:complete
MGIKRYKSLGELMLAREKEGIRKAKKKSRSMYKGLKDWEKSQIRINKQDYLPHNKKEYTEYFGPYKDSFIAQRDSSLVSQQKLKVRKSMDKLKKELDENRSLLKDWKADLKKLKDKGFLGFGKAKPEDIEHNKKVIKEYEDKIKLGEKDSTNIQFKLDKLTNKKPKLY